MSPATVDRYLAELGAALHVRGACAGASCASAAITWPTRRPSMARRRPCAPSDRRLRSPPRSIAEVAARRGVRSTVATVAGVLATGGSTLALIHAASPDATAPMGWAIAFFVAAQVAAVAAALALVQALVLRRATMSAADVGCSPAATAARSWPPGVTMFSAGAAVPGRGSADLLLAGPVLVCVALVAVLRARSLARRLDGRARRVRPPLADLGRLVRLPVPALGARRLLLVTTCIAAVGAFAARPRRARDGRGRS